MQEYDQISSSGEELEDEMEEIEEVQESSEEEIL